MYFDPGTGSLLIQAIIASIAVLGGYFAVAKTKLKNVFTKKKPGDKADGTVEDSKDADDTF